MFASDIELILTHIRYATGSWVCVEFNTCFFFNGLRTRNTLFNISETECRVFDEHLPIVHVHNKISATLFYFMKFITISSFCVIIFVLNVMEMNRWK